MRFGRGLALIVGVAVIGVIALIYFGLDGMERQETPPEVLDGRGTEAVDPSFAAEKGTRESGPAAAREMDRTASSGRPDPGAGALGHEAIPDIEESSQAAAERLGTGDRTVAGARAPRREAGSSGARAGGRDDEGYQDEGDQDEGYQELGGASDPARGEVLVTSEVLITCANSPVLCRLFSLDSEMSPGTISVASDGNEAMLIPMGGIEPDIVYIRTGDGVIMVRAENIAHPDQLDTLVREVVSRH